MLMGTIVPEQMPTPTIITVIPVLLPVMAMGTMIPIPLHHILVLLVGTHLPIMIAIIPLVITIIVPITTIGKLLNSIETNL